MKKTFALFFIICIMSSCCAQKKSVENTKKETPIESVEVDAEIVNEVENEVAEVKIENKKITERVKAIEEVEAIKDVAKPLAKKNAKILNHSLWNNLLNKHVTEQGNVNYKGFKKDGKLLKDYLTVLAGNLPQNNWSKEQQLCYWINAYNAMTVDLILRHYPIKSIKDIDKPWEQRFWKLGDKWYNLDEIEHQILRKMNEPRIHFAIVCASYSCPKLLNEAYTASNLETQLTEATKLFLADNNRNVITQNNIKLSKIFKWFAKDFKHDGTLINYLNRYSEIKISASAKKDFLDYNWRLNE